MPIEALVARYGLPALLVGAGLEGEAVVVAGGLLAHQGLVPLAGVMAVTALGSFIADQLWFAVGRRFRDSARVQRVKRKAAFARALKALERHPVGFIFAFRFVYGFRTVSPIAIGTAGVSPRLFLPVNAVAAVVWAVTFSAVGFFFGDAFERVMGRLHPHGHRIWWLVGGLILAGLIVGAVHWWRKGRE